MTPLLLEKKGPQREFGLRSMDQPTDDPNSGLFPRTRWTLVGHLRHDPASPQGRRALEQLCGAYWYPLYVYARRFGLAETDAKDAVQDLFVRLMDGNRFALADATRGRMRTFLLSSLKHLMTNQREKQQAARRGGDRTIFPLDMTDAEGRYIAEAESHELTPEQAYDRKWALELVTLAKDHLRDRYAREGKARLFDALSPALMEDKGWTDNATAAEALAMNEGAVKVALHRLRLRFREVLLEEIRQTVDEEHEVKIEVAHLLELFGSSRPGPATC